MASPVKINHAATTGERQENIMENQTITIENVVALSESLGALEANANQTQLAEAIADATLVQIAAVSNHGDRITGSAERAVAAWFNEEFPLSLCAQNWFEVEHRDTTDISKKVAVPKKDLYTVWGKKKASTKFARVRTYGRELAEPMLLAMIAELPEDEREEAYSDNDLLSPAKLAEMQDVYDKCAEETTTTSKNRDLYERSVVELGKLYRALNATDNDAVIKAHAKGQELQDALVDVTKALKTLGAPTEDEDLVKFMKEVAKR
jgi:hypothetical protein|tara:strand:+ start:226 stop:1017 length:792 start_codon:yes stop_codon:yes gene_type:complete